MSKMVSTGTGGLTGSKFRPPQEQAIRELLTKHACPHGYHAVRTYLLGSIARPAPTVKPLDAVARLWGGIFPDFESLDDMDALLGAIVVGLWNELSRHRNPEMPFKVVALPMEPTAINLSNFALVRAQEAEGFVEGLFGGDLSAALPERAHEAVAYLYDIRGCLENRLTGLRGGWRSDSGFTCGRNKAGAGWLRLPRRRSAIPVI